MKHRINILQPEDLEASFYSAKERQFLTTVLRHTGCFVMRQYCSGTGKFSGRAASDLARKLKSFRNATTRPLAKNGVLYDLTNQYPPSKFRRVKLALMKLDFILSHPGYGWSKSLSIDGFPVAQEAGAPTVATYIDARPFSRINFSTWLEKHQEFLYYVPSALLIYVTHTSRDIAPAERTFSRLFPLLRPTTNPDDPAPYRAQTVTFSACCLPNRYAWLGPSTRTGRKRP